MTKLEKITKVEKALVVVLGIVAGFFCMNMTGNTTASKVTVVQSR